MKKKEKEAMETQESFMQAMIKKCDSENLLKLANIIEMEIEGNAIKIWSVYSPEQMIKSLDKEEPILELEYIISQACYLSAIESELKERGLLKEHRKDKVYINYEEQDIRMYETYEQRFRHLIYMKLNGFLENNRVYETILELRRQEQELKEKQKEEELDDDPTPNIQA